MHATRCSHSNMSEWLQSLHRVACNNCTWNRGIRFTWNQEAHVTERNQEAFCVVWKVSHVNAFMTIYTVMILCEIVLSFLNEISRLRYLWHDMIPVHYAWVRSTVPKHKKQRAEMGVRFMGDWASSFLPVSMVWYCSKPIGVVWGCVSGTLWLSWHYLILCIASPDILYICPFFWRDASKSSWGKNGIVQTWSSY